MKKNPGKNETHIEGSARKSNHMERLVQNIGFIFKVKKNINKENLRTYQ